MNTPHSAEQLRPAANPRPGQRYQARLAETPPELALAQALRFQVFNIELDEGLVDAYDNGLDADPFDAVCAHLLVEDELGMVVGTYRMQTGVQARAALGYYSEREFDFSPLERHRAQILELGRACIHHQHRTFAVLNLLWKGIGTHAQAHGARYLVGCSSLTSRDEAVGAAAFAQLNRHLAPAAWLTRPQPDHACELTRQVEQPVHIPRLLSAYLTLGAAICGPPAIDREFGTIDFLTWIDVESPLVVAMQSRGRFVV